MELFLGGLVELVSGAVRNLFRNVTTVPCYRDGFFAGLVVALVVGGAARRLLYWWSRVLQFFGPTPAPAIDKGPSPMARLGQSFRALVLLLLAVALGAAVLALATAGAG